MPSLSTITALAVGGLLLAGAAPAAAHTPATAHTAPSARTPGAGITPAAARVWSGRSARSRQVGVDLASAPVVPHAAWLWPVGPRHQVLRPFDVGPFRWSAGHRGVDLAVQPGSPVRAPASGRVRFVGVVAGRPVLSIDHGALISTYEPVVSGLSAGDAVAAGEVIGRLSALPGHCSPAACLHWGVRRGETYLDPLTLLGPAARPVILKPLGGPG